MSRIPSLGPRGEGWVALQLVLLAAIAVSAIGAGVPVSGSVEAAAMAVGFVVLVGGLAIFGLGIAALGSSLSPLPAPIPTGVLVDRGVYRFMRHPIYTGLVVAAVGGSIYAVSPLALGLTVVLAVVLDLKSRREEAWLRERFVGYAAYAARTKRFVPGLY
jgi:protein-S-isoprenylcysteine O-methyltransferase Ste14